MSTPQYPPPYQPKSPDADQQDRLRILTHVLYALYAVFWLVFGISVLVAIIINYVKRDDVIGTPYEEHFTWQIRTFWIGLICPLVWLLLCLVLAFFLGTNTTLEILLLYGIVSIGFLGFGVAALWVLYRIIKGWLYLYEGKSLQDPRRLV